MKELTIKEYLDKYTYLKDMSNYTMFITYDEYEKINKSESIIVDSMPVNIEFLKRVLKDDYYTYMYKYFNNDINAFSITSIYGLGKLPPSISYNKIQIIKGIDKLILENKLSLSLKEQERYDILKNKIAFEYYINRNKNNYYNIVIDNNEYNVLVNDIISFMLLNEEDFKNISDKKYINNIPIDHFAYIVYRYFEDNRLYLNYLLPQYIYDRFINIKDYKLFDIQAFNRHLYTRDTKYKEISLDRDLEKEIIKGLPENSSQIEKAVYIYIKMCRLLSYDDEYYAAKDNRKVNKKHKDINYIKSINLTNNKVVCYEFNLIYSKFLNDLGIKFSSDYKGENGEVYGVVHADLDFRSDKFLVNADSLTSILQGDMIQAKLNQPLIGLKCLNKNEDTQNEFKNIIIKIHNLIIKQDKEKYNKNITNTFDDTIDNYIKIVNNMDLKDKLVILLDKINKSNLVGVDAISYLLKLRKVLFNEQEKENNIYINIIRDNKPKESNKIATICAIITINNNINENIIDNDYYILYSNNELNKIFKEELETNFNKKQLEYINEDDNKIPGLFNKEIKKHKYFKL